MKRELELREKQLTDKRLHYRTLERICIEERIYKKDLRQCKTNEAVIASVFDGFKPFKSELVRELVAAKAWTNYCRCIRRISFSTSINTGRNGEDPAGYRRDAQKSKESNPLRRRYLEALLEKYGPLYPRLTTKSARHQEVDAKAVAFKAFKVAYDRETGYVGYKVSGEEFKAECTKFDKLVLVFKDGTHKGVRAAGKTVRWPGIVLLRFARSRAHFHVRLHRPRCQLLEALHFRRLDLE